MTAQELDTLRPIRYCQSSCHRIGRIQRDTNTFPCRNTKRDLSSVVQTGHKHAAVIKDDWERKHPGCTRVNGNVIRDGMIGPIY